ncbi:sugar nucleotide-binding protein [Streptomyces sp. ITFR-16]|uniref:SDR family oxidoreductase n=1 Tax=Streptomyces sp. ITFR-16 TaxID=3075198 RepID=UPI00288A5324|nr:sugar nucleotide-binding protein [Streptomyces sp. ITFR-16]WNI27212.1 sugar nucleotide-binding protein [Streptomyces sp. ITFR-16]
MTRWLVTGARGLLGRELLPALDRAGQPYTALGHEDLDVTDPRAVRAAMAAHRPGVVVNTAAASDPARAPQVNGAAPRRLADACGEFGALLLHLSTADVFSGNARTPYAEDALPCPLNTRGRTRLEGERSVLQLLPWTGYVVRTSWLYGAGRFAPAGAAFAGERSAGFVSALVRLERERDFVEVAAEQYGQPTWSADAAAQVVSLGLAALGGTASPGIYHATSRGRCTRVELAREVFRLLGADPSRIRPVPATSSRPPRYTVLGHDRWRPTDVDPIRDWRTGLRAALPALLGAPGVRRGAVAVAG